MKFSCFECEPHFFSFQIHRSVAKLSKGALTHDSHVLEVSGPLLPHHTLNISALLRERVTEPAIISINTHEHSAPFNLGFKTHTENSTTDKAASLSGNGKVERLDTVINPLRDEMILECSADEERNNDELSGAKEHVLDGTFVAGGLISNQNPVLGGFITDGNPATGYPLNHGSCCSKGDLVKNENPVSENPVRDGTLDRGDPSSKVAFAQGNLTQGTSVQPKSSNGTPNSVHCFSDADIKNDNGGGLPLNRAAVINSKADVGIFCGVGSWGNGLHSTARNQLCAKSGLDGVVLREVTCLPGGFMWS